MSSDIDPETFCIDHNDIERWVTPRTKAIMVVHCLGTPADMDAIMKMVRETA
ncbi:MAG: DegT/DnrJ/EryC1/StrS family aminotransferase [Thermoproteota archaeon]